MKLIALLAGHFTRFRRVELQDVAAGLYAAPSFSARAATRIVNGTLRARRLLYVEVGIRSRQAASRLRYAMRNGQGGAAAPQPRVLSLLCPTRERVANVRTFLQSVRKTAANPGRIEVLFYIDADDPQKDAYAELLRGLTRRWSDGPRCVPLVGEPTSVCKAWNILAEHASGDVLMMANDDQVYVDYGWDARVDEECAKFPDGVVCMYFDDGQYHEDAVEKGRKGDFPIVTRRWYETLGYFTPALFEFWSNEAWILDIARRLGRLHAISGVFVEHLHYDAYKSPYDMTYHRHRATREKSRRDATLYVHTAPLRDMASERLADAMREPSRAS